VGTAWILKNNCKKTLQTIQRQVIEVEWHNASATVEERRGDRLKKKKEVLRIAQSRCGAVAVKIQGKAAQRAPSR